MELADDDTLRSVDDERAKLGQKREVTEVHLLLDNVLRTAVLNWDGLLLFLPLFWYFLFVFFWAFPHNEPERGLQRCCIGHIPLYALLH